MITVSANGEDFDFPDGTTDAQIGEALDEYFSGKTAPKTPPPVRQTPEQMKQAQEAEYDALQKQNVEDMGFFGRAVAGYGSAMPAIGGAIKQLYAGATGNEEMSQRLMAEEAERRKIMAPLEDTWGGKLGTVAGNIAAGVPAAMVAGAAAPAGLLGAAGAGAVSGAAMGALAPTVREGERTENMLWGGGIGAALPVAGAGIRSAAGTLDPAMESAAETLKKYGISTSRGDISPGGISRTANAVLENTPGVNVISKSMASGKEDKVRKALFSMLGTDEIPTTNSEMIALKEGLGEQLGKFSSGKYLDMSGIAGKVDDAMVDYKKLLPSQMDKSVLDAADQLKALANLPKGKLKGEAYQAIRSDLSTAASRADPAKQKVLRGFVSALDDSLERTLSPEEVLAKKAVDQRYRIANALAKKADLSGGEGLSISRARKILEDTNKRGRVMPEALDLLRAADTAIPKVNTNIDLKKGAIGAIGMMNPAVMAKVLGLGVAGKAATNTGIPQYLAKSPTTRALTSQYLRGVTQTELSDED